MWMIVVVIDHYQDDGPRMIVLPTFVYALQKDEEHPWTIMNSNDYVYRLSHNVGTNVTIPNYTT